MKTRSAELTVEWWPIEKPTPYARNARVCPESAIAKVAASLKEFGLRQPIVVDEEGVIIAGHTRLLAAQRLGLEQVPVHVATDLTPRAGQGLPPRRQPLARRRPPGTSSCCRSSSPSSPASSSTSRSPASSPTSSPPSWPSRPRASPIPTRCRSCPRSRSRKPGDLYLLGEHRLLCGDATNADDVERLMAGEEGQR